MPVNETAGSQLMQTWRALWRGADTASLPQRVKAIVAMEDRASERLIGAVQVGIGLTLWATNNIFITINMLC